MWTRHNIVHLRYIWLTERDLKSLQSHWCQYVQTCVMLSNVFIPAAFLLLAEPHTSRWNGEQNNNPLNYISALTTNALFLASNQTSIARRLEVDNLPNLNKPDNRIYTEVMDIWKSYTRTAGNIKNIIPFKISLIFSGFTRLAPCF